MQDQYILVLDGQIDDVGCVGKVDICFVDQYYVVFGFVFDCFDDLFVWGEGVGWVVWVVDIDQFGVVLCGGEYVFDVVGCFGVQWYGSDFCFLGLGGVNYGVVGGIGDDQVVFFVGECCDGVLQWLV